MIFFLREVAFAHFGFCYFLISNFNETLNFPITYPLQLSYGPTGIFRKCIIFAFDLLFL